MPLTPDDLLRALRLVERHFDTPVTTYPVIDLCPAPPLGIEDAYPDLIVIPPFDRFVVAILLSVGGDPTDPAAEWPTRLLITEWRTVHPAGDERWSLTADISLVETRTEDVQTPAGRCVVNVDSDGQWTDYEWRDWTDPDVVVEDVDYDESGNPTAWRTAILWSLAALNFLNCRNVHLVDPQFPRALRRRIERAGGVRISRIEVTDPGTSTRTVARDAEGRELPLHQVRGHFARYGQRYGRGLLFGKHAGQFWVPGHERGLAAHGEVRHQYVPRSA